MNLTRIPMPPDTDPHAKHFRIAMIAVAVIVALAAVQQAAAFGWGTFRAATLASALNDIAEPGTVFTVDYDRGNEFTIEIAVEPSGDLAGNPFRGLADGMIAMMMPGLCTEALAAIDRQGYGQPDVLTLVVSGEFDARATC